MIAVETLFLTALLSAFIGLIGLLALAGPAVSPLVRYRSFLGNLVILAAIVSVGSFFFYALSPHRAARSVYGDSAASTVRL
jgi:hypothetical protein